MHMRGEQGFTLPELFAFVVLVLALLVAGIIFAHPHDYSSQTRNANRWMTLSQYILTLDKYIAKEGKLPPGITDKPQMMGSESGMINLCPSLVPAYLDDMLYDPIDSLLASSTNCLEKGALYATGFTIQATKDKKVTIAAPGAENGEQISLTKAY